MPSVGHEPSLHSALGQGASDGSEVRTELQLAGEHAALTLSCWLIDISWSSDGHVTTKRLL